MPTETRFGKGGEDLNFNISAENPLRLIELFAGYGSQAMALKRAGVPFEYWRAVEFDKYAVKSYNAVHGTDIQPTDIRDIHAADLGITHTYIHTYMMTYSFPCQDLSVAGYGKGMEEGSGTRSSLLWEVKRLLEECSELPQILMMENVPQVHGKKNMAVFERWIDTLKGMGYNSVWKDLNAKDYGVPQQRNRTFMFSVLDNSFVYEWPEPIPLEKRLKDVLEENVDEKYYIGGERVQKLLTNLVERGILPDTEGGQKPIDGTLFEPKEKEVSNTVKARMRDIENRRSDGNAVICARSKS